ncbi:hypothetical protein AAVH_34629 [Aphelenchoides avenae]|nr:hypothetical protein AAVH_34629 [Aphelenchus avenae]
MKSTYVLIVLATVLLSTGTCQDCPTGPCPGSVSNGCNWCASGGADFLKYIGTCSNGCAIFRECGAGTACVDDGNCNVHCA